jgi:Ala-tRNA(Pro) deacylase
MHLTEYLAQHHVEFEFLQHAPAFSAPRLASQLRLPGTQVAKTVLLRGPDSLLLAVLPSTHQVDLAALSCALGGPVRLARAEDMVDVFYNCEFGMAPPFGKLYGLPVWLDDSIPSDSLLVFEGQTCVESVRMRCSDFERLEKPRRLTLARKQTGDEIEAFPQLPAAVSSCNSRSSNGCR